ncbi:MAG: ParB/Srx family N-terminal domain-containing protein [Phycisphaerae bacterium]
MKTRLENLLPHPNSCSYYSQSLKEKLLRHIQSTGLYPPIIVRSLKNSKKFPSNNGHLQIIDGHLRFEILKDLNQTHAEVINFGPLSDRQTELLLLTLNQLRSAADPQKRAQLLKSHLADHNLTLDHLQQFLPDSKIVLQRLLNLTNAHPKITDPKNLPTLPKPFAVYLSPNQHTLVKFALEKIKKSHSAQSLAHALELLAQNFLKQK